MTEDLSKARNLSPAEIEKLKEEAQQASQAMDDARRKLIDRKNEKRSDLSQRE